MIAKVYSAIPHGYEGRIIEVEGDMNKGLPAFNIVGMAAKTVSEARERVRSAIVNSGFSFPHYKTTINLAPAELIKNGAHLDLPIALAVLTLSGQLLPQNLEQKLFVGELSLDGRTKPLRGIINIVETARTQGYREVFLPADNLQQAMLVPNLTCYGVRNLSELFLHLKGVKLLKSYQTTNQASLRLASRATPVNVKNTELSVKLDQIRGQTLAKRALAIAVAGRHNLLLSGPPGAGKTLLARAALNLLPPPTPDEAIAITKIHSLFQNTDTIITERPFRAPHHSASTISILGGGAQAIPGEVTLAHHGILFLDELPEYPRAVLESLRQPLEDGQISVTRAHLHITYPAQFMLIATMNPCPCGHLGDPAHECKCTSVEINRYQKKLSGPMLDRIDLVLNLRTVSPAELTSPAASPNKNVKNTSTEKSKFSSPHVKITSTEVTYPEHEHVKNTIIEATNRQHHRYHPYKISNGRLTAGQIQRFIRLTPAAKRLLAAAAKSLQLSARSYFKVIKVAQTISDLDGITEVGAEQISESLAFRQRLN